MESGIQPEKGRRFGVTSWLSIELPPPSPPPHPPPIDARMARNISPRSEETDDTVRNRTLVEKQIQRVLAGMQVGFIENSAIRKAA